MNIPNNKGRLHPSIPSDRGSYIYFLIKSGDIVYVGQSRNIRNRIYNHRYKNDFDHIRIIPCPADKLEYYEKRWIRKFEPKINSVHTKKARSGILKYKTNYHATKAREYRSKLQGRAIHNKYCLNYARKKKEPKFIKKEKLRALVLAGLPVDMAAERLGIRLKKIDNAQTL